MPTHTQRWIVIPHWDEFQHRDATRTQSHPWIKNYTRLLHDDAYLSLTGHQRAILHGLWLLYASSRCQLVANTASLTRQLGLRVSSQQLEALNQAGLVTFSAGKPASLEQKRTEKNVLSSTAVVSYAGEAAALKKNAKSRPRELPPDLLEQVDQLSGADERTHAVLGSFIRRGLPEAAFRNALEATREASKSRRLRGSQVGYLVGTLRQIEKGGQYP